VDRLPLDDAVEVQPNAGRDMHRVAFQPDVSMRRLDGRGRSRIVAEEREVYVVAGRLEGGPERRDDEPATRARDVEREPQHVGEGLRDRRRHPGGAVDPVELAVGPEAAERALALGEQALD